MATGPLGGNGRFDGVRGISQFYNTKIDKFKKDSDTGHFTDGKKEEEKSKDEDKKNKNKYA